MTTKTLTNEHGFHTVTDAGHDVTLVRNNINHDMTYTEIRMYGDGLSMDRFKAVIRLNTYPSQTYAKLFVWRDGWQEFHSQLITDLPAYTLSTYGKADELDISKFQDSCEHLWLMAAKYFGDEV
jgi:hypothetical protein